MRVLIVSCVFSPEPVVSAQTSSQIAEELVQRGHSVTVITTFPSRPGGRFYSNEARRIFHRETSPAGFEVIRSFSIPSRQSRLLSRLLENLSFGLTSGMVLLTTRRADVLYANTWPIIASGIIAIVARVRNIPMVVSIQDMYPESMISQRRIGANSFIARGIRWIDGLIARGSKAVIVISESFASLYLKNRRVPLARLHVVPNWLSSDGFQLEADRVLRFRESRGIPRDAFLVVYGGNVGVAAGVETVIESMRHIKNPSNLYLLIAGDGSQLKTCQTLARDIDSGRILFYTPWPAGETSLILSAADVLVLPTRGDQSAASVPSKLIAYLLAARPIIALTLPGTELANLIERSGCGWAVEPDDPKQLAVKMDQVVAMGAVEWMRRGSTGRDYALEHLTRKACLPKVINILEQVGAESSP